MFRGITLWLYGNNLRDFINHDLKIIKNGRKYLFTSKQEKLIFIVAYRDEKELSQVDLFEMADKIFYEITKMRNQNEVF